VGGQVQQFSRLGYGEELHRISLILHRFHMDNGNNLSILTDKFKPTRGLAQ
jgi:hypothetical protein